MWDVRNSGLMHCYKGKKCFLLVWLFKKENKMWVYLLKGNQLGAYWRKKAENKGLHPKNCKPLTIRLVPTTDLRHGEAAAVC